MAYSNIASYIKDFVKQRDQAKRCCYKRIPDRKVCPISRLSGQGDAKHNRELYQQI